MPSVPLLYIVDDDAEVRSLLQQYLGEHDFEVVTIESADEMLGRLRRRRPDLLVLDVMMPGTGGLDALRTLREQGDDVPAILLTARSADHERIQGLDLGADDYVSKPFNARELLSRIRAVLRRRLLAPAHRPAADDTICVGGCVLDPLRRTLSRDGQPLPLHPADFAVLWALAREPLKPLSRNRLLELTCDHSRDKSERSIDVQIVRLRRFIEKDPDKPVILQTVRGVGYVFVP
jgi:two-component system phosphate regulon response regulator OmpR